MKNLAQRVILPGPKGGPPIEINGPLGNKFGTVGDIINQAVKFLIPLAGLILFIFIIYSGYQYLTSQGDEKAMSAARARLTYAIAGFVLLLASYWIAQLVGIIFNIPIFR